MRSSLLLSILAIFTFISCEKEDLGFMEYSSRWESSGGMDKSSFDNIHFKLNMWKANHVEISIKSLGIVSYLYLLDKEKNILLETDAGIISKDLEIGEYEVVFGTKNVGETGDFRAKFVGIEDVTFVYSWE